MATPRRTWSRIASGSFQAGKAANSSAPTKKTVVAGSKLSGAQRVDRVGVVVALHLGDRDLGKGGAGELDALLDRGLDGLVRRLRDDEDEEPVEAEAVHRLAREDDVADVRRVERAAEEARGHSSSNSTTASGFTPAARSSSSVASPRTR